MDRNSEAEKWIVSSAEFRGHVKASLEGIDKSIKNLCSETKVQDIRLNKVENRLTATEVKGGFFGFIGGIIGGFLAWIIR